jgi:hypothetical protein
MAQTLISPRVVPKHEFAPFEALVNHVRQDRVERWLDIEDEFIRAVGLFDSEFARGCRNDGWYQSKTRYFNDLIAGLLGNISGNPISLRCRKRSQLFDHTELDICFPREGDPIVAGAVKALGTPPHGGNENAASGASQDLHNRVREVAFSSMDLKGAYAPPRPIASFQNWVDATSPGYFAFWAMRAKDRQDFEEVRSTLGSSRVYCNGVGAVIYVPTNAAAPTEYEVRKVTDLSIDKAIREMAQRIAASLAGS